MDESDLSRTTRWPIAPLILVLVPLLCLYPLLSCDFLRWDDITTIQKNAVLLRSPIEQIPLFFSDLKDTSTELYMPVTKSVWLLIAHLARLAPPKSDGTLFDPAYFHAANLLIHLCNVLLVYSLIGKLAGNGWPALIGAMLFAVHPLQVESVAWVSGLKDLLAACGELIALNSFVRFLDAHTPKTEPGRPRPGVRHRAIWYTIGTTALLLALLSKASAAVCPLLAMVLGIALLDRRQWIRKLLPPLLPWIALAVVFTIEARHAQPAIEVPQVRLLLRPLIATDAIWFYLGKLFIPLRMCCDYGHRPDVVLRSSFTYWSCIGVAIVIVLTLTLGKLVKWLRTGIYFSFVALLPMLGFLPFDAQHYSTVSDHYCYLAMAGIGLAAAEISRRFASTPVTRAVAVALLMVFACLSYFQTSFWQNNTVFFTHALDVNPHSFKSIAVLGKMAEEANQPDVAEADFKRSIKEGPDFGTSYYDLGDLMLREGRFADAVAAFGQLELVWPKNDNCRNNMGVALLALHRPSDAAVELREAIRLNPMNASAESNLGRAAQMTGDRADAISHYRRALQLEPDLPSALRGLWQSMQTPTSHSTAQ